MRLCEILGSSKKILKEILSAYSNYTLDTDNYNALISLMDYHSSTTDPELKRELVLLSTKLLNYNLAVLSKKNFNDDFGGRL
ncbi:hypothetical protein UFOVP116_316 [uncultured Caudovirales phage]|uniref:Uncharacterized protein n=1 Tax=uncultured Caudovirales phage TaxID=2100421 RepID=A0A6J5LA79_9CAUD|nr:hypothetical protein UFOVP116_316 [uncultured Caudovirales phage]